MTTYTERELIEAAGTLPWLQRVLDRARRMSGGEPWHQADLLSAGYATGFPSAIRDLLGKIDSDREPCIVNRDDTLTYEELESYFDRQKMHNSYAGGLDIDRIARDIEAHREKLLDGRTYRSASGGYYQWDETGYVFRTFGETGGILRDIPERPLELLP